MKWKTYQIQEGCSLLGIPPISTKIHIIEAPSVGVAVEFFLATHGTARRVIAEVSNNPPDDGCNQRDVLALMSNAEALTVTLDKFHTIGGLTIVPFDDGKFFIHRAVHYHPTIVKI